jgi:peptidyl-prolyl cis-trans isomerase A (cyclophilin A)
MSFRFVFLLLAAAGGLAQASTTPHVWMDTDRGQIVLELDPARAPQTVAHFRTIVQEGHYNGLVFHRTIPGFVIQSGRVDANGNNRVRPGTVASEVGNGLQHVAGTISIALSSTNNQVNRNSGTTEFFINTGTNTSLNPDFTVFGKVVFGMPTVIDIGNGITYSNQTPFRPTLIRRAVNSDGFPIMNLHTGAWFDPQNEGRGFSVEISHPAGAESLGPLVVIYWYDYFEGKQIWMTGVAPFAYGASEVTIPLQITDGGEFGEAYDRADVSKADFGSLTLRFSGCNAGSFTYDTIHGSGSMQLQRLTIPGGERCQ